MGPFTFLNGAFLAALAAAALPILIHLFSRRRAVERPFSHLEMLDEITRKKIRRLRLRQWILLALRTLAIALIALALARPVWHGAGTYSQRGSSTVAILIDDSYSMGALLDPATVLPVDAEGEAMAAPTRFEEARQRALQILDLLEEGDRAVLVFTASPVRVPYESTVRDPSLLREEILRAKPRATRSNLAAAFERVYPILSSAQTLNREVFVVSDFQQNQMEEILRGVGSGETADEGPTTPDSAAVLPSLVPVPPEAQVYLLPVVAPSTPNLAVVWALFERDPAGLGGRLTIRLRNYGDTPVEDHLVQVVGGRSGRLLAEGFVDVDAGAVTQTVISIEEAPESGLLGVRGGNDLLAIDNTYYLSTSATQRFKVLIVTRGPLEDPAVLDEATFPVLALDPWGGADVLARAAQSGGAGAVGEGEGTGAGTGAEAEISRSPFPPAGAVDDSEGLRLFEVTLVPERDLGLRGEIDADAVLLLNVGRLGAAATELLAQYRSEGGGIFIALGDRIDARVYNTQILPGIAELRLENVVGDVTGDAHFSLRPAVTGHDIFDGFPVAPGEALSSARFRRLLEVRPGEATRVLAEFSGGYPALAEEPGVLLFTSALDMKWSDFPTSASYLPFLHRGLLHLILGGKAGREAPTVGRPLRHPLPKELEGEAFRCVGPDGLEIPVEVVLGDRGRTLQTAPVPEPGFYMLGTGRAALGVPMAGGTTEQALQGRAPIVTEAVNLDVRESDLQSLDAEQLDFVFGSDAQRLAPEETLSRQVLEARYGRELWQLCLALAFGLLLAESLLGRGRIRR